MKTEDTIQKFAEAMIIRMEQMTDRKWEKEWLTNTFVGNPCNLNGREYNGMNAFLLLLMQVDGTQYKYPVYATYKQIQEKGASVKKGEKACPVLYWNFVYKDGNGNKISEDTYNSMPTEQRNGCSRNGYLRVYHVFNIDQTTLEEDAPLVIEKKKQRFGYTDVMPTDTFGMYENAAIDDVLTFQKWLCPIHYKDYSSSAFYSSKAHEITIPTKTQFRIGKSEDEVYVNGQQYYSTLIHEMIHSTAKETGRNIKSSFGDTKYAKEELVAELGAALVCNSIGFKREINDSNAAYLNSWIKILKKEPKFILSVLSDVSKASGIVLDVICKERKVSVCA